ncbi:MAG TPA: hypothetical protein VJ806_05810 [Luteimonas sp.]|nr:hypothetical protein [Luteimonas sp.]
MAAILPKNIESCFNFETVSESGLRPMKSALPQLDERYARRRNEPPAPKRCSIETFSDAATQRKSRNSRGIDFNKPVFRSKNMPLRNINDPGH